VEAWGSRRLVSYFAGYFAPVLDSVSILPRQAWSRERGIVTSTSLGCGITFPLSPLAIAAKSHKNAQKSRTPGSGTRLSPYPFPIFPFASFLLSRDRGIPSRLSPFASLL
jgi:hypothetical protein